MWLLFGTALKAVTKMFMGIYPWINLKCVFLFFSFNYLCQYIDTGMREQINMFGFFFYFFNKLIRCSMGIEPYLEIFLSLVPIQGQ